MLHEAWTHALHLCHPARMPGFSERERRFLFSTPDCSLAARRLISRQASFRIGCNLQRADDADGPSDADSVPENS